MCRRTSRTSSQASVDASARTHTGTTVKVGGGSRVALLALFVVATLLALPNARPTVARAAACGTTASAVSTVYLPNVTKTLGGPAGWVTPFYVQNTGTIQTAVEITFYRFSDGAQVVCRRTTGLAPGTSLVDDPNADTDLPDNTQFSVIVKSFAAPVVAIVNQVQGSGASQQALSYSGFTSGATTVYVPNVTRRFFGWDVPLIVQNLGTVATSATATFTSAASPSCTTPHTYARTQAIDPGKSKVFDPDFEAAYTGAPGSGLLDGCQYSVVVTSPQPVALVVNAHNEVGGASAYSHNGIAAGGTTLFAPYAVRSTTLFSNVVVQNLGTAPLSATLTFTPLGPGTPQVFTLAAIPARGAKPFDVRYTGGDTALAFCGTTVATGCLAPGEYALTIAATSPIAAVVLPVSATTAAGYLASATPTPRALAPAVFRTVGGPTGWTTTLYLQSVTAAQATLRWFRLDTGDLAATQTLTLAAGRTTRVDPRSVSGLAENTQYATTIDANGTLAAIAFEQAQTGGDASMIFEAVALPAQAPTGQPGSVRLSPTTVTVATGGTQQFTASVRDQFGVLMASGQTWSVTPASLGSVSWAGLFTAGSAAGAGTLTVTSGQVSASAAVTVSAPTTATVGGISFVVRATATADVYTDSTITTADAQAIAATVDGDVAKVQTEFARSFATRPSIYVFGTVQNATAGNQSIFNMTPTMAAQYATAGGFFDTDSSTSVVVNWYNIKDSRPITTTRHELAHMMIQQIAGKFTWIPAWFNEGNARLIDNTAPGAGWWANTNRYVAVSAAAQVPSRLLPLADLVDQRVWAARTPPAAYFQYYEASRAAQFVRDDVGVAGTIRILELLRQGPSGPTTYVDTFNAAFQTVTGTSFPSFAAAFPERLKASVPRYPGLAATTETPGGPGLHFVAYGFSPSTAVTYTLSGPSSGTFTATTDEYGALRRYFTTAFNGTPGSYVVTVTESSTKSATASATLAAASSAETNTAGDFERDAGAPFGRADPWLPAE